MIIPGNTVLVLLGKKLASMQGIIVMMCICIIFSRKSRLEIWTWNSKGKVNNNYKTTTSCLLTMRSIYRKWLFTSKPNSVTKCLVPLFTYTTHISWSLQKRVLKILKTSIFYKFNRVKNIKNTEFCSIHEHFHHALSDYCQNRLLV